jgi:hypothetical protein
MGEEDDSSPDIEDFPIACPNCGSQMRLFAIERETEGREIYTFVCDFVRSRGGARRANPIGTFLDCQSKIWINIKNPKARAATHATDGTF